MIRKLGKTYIETWVEIPTKFQNGKQYYKNLRTWTAIPHEVIDPIHLRALNKMMVETLDGTLDLYVEALNPGNSRTPRYYIIRAVVETHITITSKE